MLRKLNSLVKDFIFVSGIAYIFYPFRKLFVFFSNLSELSVWIHHNKKNIEQKDFFVWKRDYNKRLDGFDFIVKKFDLENQAVIYLEFGVASGASFEWWLNHLKHPSAVFFGFDTFEGLPEDWGVFFKKGSMSHDVKRIPDSRHSFIKGIFQDTMVNFINNHRSTLESGKQKIIHLDADLFSATLFVLSQLYPYLNEGDVLIFDEFSVPNHEYYAVKLFQQCFYMKLKPISALNNFYQTIFVIEK
jgi:O-methyltransferase